eukprot:GHVT01066137.1.p1 GENE.GHVT01066137.1~~GHVT01066137.1.p1  ORF type:complete len:170 (-),score=11.85 GHVT01066137.1:940-1449(-)
MLSSAPGCLSFGFRQVFGADGKLFGMLVCCCYLFLIFVVAVYWGPERLQTTTYSSWNCPKAADLPVFDPALCNAGVDLRDMTSSWSLSFNLLPGADRKIKISAQFLHRAMPAPFVRRSPYAIHDDQQLTDVGRDEINAQTSQTTKTIITARSTHPRINSEGSKGPHTHA